MTWGKDETGAWVEYDYTPGMGGIPTGGSSGQPTEFIPAPADVPPMYQGTIDAAVIQVGEGGKYGTIDTGNALPGGEPLYEPPIVDPVAFLPGGAPLTTPQGPWEGLRIVKTWFTSKSPTWVKWVKLNDGTVWVMSEKKLTWKKVKKGRAVVIGKDLNAKNLRKALGVLKKFNKVPRVKGKGKKKLEVLL